MFLSDEKKNTWCFTADEIENGACIEVLPDVMPPFEKIKPITGLFAIARAKHFSPLPQSGGMYVVYVPGEQLKAASEGCEGDDSTLSATVQAENDTKFFKSSGATSKNLLTLLGNETEFRIVAYIDMFGRLFAEKKPIFASPARMPDVWFNSDLYEKCKQSGESSIGEPDSGCVSVVDWKSEKIQALANFSFNERDGFKLADSWYDFGDFAENLTYEQALARCYLAFSLRPELGAPKIPDYERDPDLENFLLKSISDRKLFSSLNKIVSDIEYAMKDKMLHVPGLIQLFVENIKKAGLTSANSRHVTDKDAYLIRQKPYSGDCYIMEVQGQTTITPREMWGIEGVINRFRHLCNFPQLIDASLEECRKQDAQCIIPFTGTFDSRTIRLPEDIPDRAECEDELCEMLPLNQVISMTHRANDMPNGIDGGEWNARCAFAVELERMRLPIRVGVDFRFDWYAKKFSIGFMAPSDTMMPAGQKDAKLAKHQAQIYAQCVGVILAHKAFRLIERLQTVSVFAHILPEDGADTRIPPAYFSVEFNRDLNLDPSQLTNVPSIGKPYPIYKLAGAKFNVDGLTLPNTTANHPLYESWGKSNSKQKRIPFFSVPGLGATSAHDLDVEYNTNYRNLAENIADKLISTKTTSAAIAVVSKAQESKAFKNDTRAQLSCTRLMEALAQGSVEANDQNAVVTAFLGEDRCSIALKRAKKIEHVNPKEALDILTTAINETQLLDGVCDSAHTVYRYFDGYTSRVLYNLSRKARYDFVPQAADDKHKQVLPAPDSYYMCYLKSIKLLERSFSSTDEALRYAIDLVKLAPATPHAHRELARMYTLTGDFASAKKVLLGVLGMLHQNDEIALVYYQLGYVLWKSGQPEEGCACYLKSLKMSHIVAMECGIELQKLLAETHITPRTDIDPDALLIIQDIECAPTIRLRTVMELAVTAAADAHLERVARSLLSTYLQYNHDNVLMDVLSSYA